MPADQSARRRISLDGKKSAEKRRFSFSSISFSPRRRKSLAVAIVAPIVVIAALATGIATASACHPLIEAGADCNGQVSFTATAWNDSDATNDSRTNDNVAIQYSINGVDGPFTTVQSGDTNYEFQKSNNFSFSDKFMLPSNLKRPTNVTIRAVALTKWGTNENIDVANQAASTTIRVPAECSVPSVKIAGPSCTVATAKVTLASSSTEPVEFGLFKDNSTQPFDVETVTNGSIVKQVTVNTQFQLTVKAKNSNVAPVTQVLQPASDCVHADSAISKVCKTDASGWTVTFDNSASSDIATFVVKSGNNTLDTVQVAAGRKQTASYSFADAGVSGGSTIPVAVYVNNRVVANESVTNDCVNATADVSTACDTAAGSGALLTFTNTGQVAETFTVVRDGKAVDGSPFVLQPSNDATKKLLRLNDGDTATISVMSSSGLNVQKQVTLNCPSHATTPPAAQVKGETVNRPQLAMTGANIMPMSILGGLLLLTGFSLFGIRRTL